MRILVTGFEPFLEHRLNPSADLCESVVRRTSKDLELLGLILPVSYKDSFQILSANLNSQKYDALFMLGLAASRENVSIEKIALNRIHCQDPDQNGLVYTDQIIEAQGPLALETKMKLAPLPDSAELSFYAGTYVCNYLYFKILYLYPHLPSLFIHIPKEGQFEESIYNFISETARLGHY